MTLLKIQSLDLLSWSKLSFVTAVMGSALSAASGQEPPPNRLKETESNKAPNVSVAEPGVVKGRTRLEPLTERERLLLERLDQLERRVAELESKQAPGNESSSMVSSPVNVAEQPVMTTANPPPQANPEDREFFDFIRDTTFNVTLDGYYGYNFNRPVGGINLLRAYDVTSNSFSLNQAALVIESAPNLEKGKRYGLRLDLQYGQATETVQGNAANEPRPQVYRPLWQAYGTYVFDVGSGLTVDFGKFAGALGYETNYTKDNFNYSRAYFYNFLPFYHAGFRTTYAFNDKVTLTHWLVNGVQQSEDFNGFKSQAVLLTWKPTPRVTSQFNYYNGQEQRDRNPALNPTFAPVASQPGLSTDVIRPVPSGRFHVLDTYHTFNVTDKLTLAVEGDYVVGRVFRDSPPATVWGGVGYARYQVTPKFAIAGRFEYLDETVSSAGGLFSGVSQALKEHTVTAEYKFAAGFLGRAEYRRDFSNQPFFLTERPGILKQEQNTATIGLVWWFGRKQGTW
jgi:Putative beta-barrel porin-2, OmpL-like. bbp2